MKYVSNKHDVPTAPHYAVLKFSSIFIPGDQRSIDHPGHGYGEHQQGIIEYLAFTTLQEAQAWVLENEKEEYLILNTSPMRFKVEKKLVEDREPIWPRC